jgi:LDH2 family malate/lactate/ureidoglycolate dehydrogenase
MIAAITPEALRAWSTAILEQAGAVPEAADAVAECLVDASVRGVDSHGVVLLSYYLPRLRSGAIAGNARPEIVHEEPAVAVVDGHDALGAFVGTFAMDHCCDKAAQAGSAVVVVRNSSHFGAASFFSERAAERGFVGIAMTNTEPGLAPAGALGPVLGTNPVAIAAPGGMGDPVLSLDVATSVVARNRIFIADARGLALEPGWAIGPDGAPTEDAGRALAGAMLPIGGHKGFGLAFMIDVLTACLSGATSSPWVKGGEFEKERVGHFFLAVRLEAIRDLNEYRACAQELIGAVRGAQRASDIEPFLVPGEREAMVAADRRSRIPLDEATLSELNSLGREFGIPFTPDPKSGLQ